MITQAKTLQIVLGEIRQEFGDYATERGLPRDQVDAVFRTILTAMLGPPGSVQ
jgi:hypothetical protein